MSKEFIKQIIKEMIDKGEIKINLQLDIDKAYVDSGGMVQHGGSGDFVTDVELFLELEVVDVSNN